MHQQHGQHTYVIPAMKPVWRRGSDTYFTENNTLYYREIRVQGLIQWEGLPHIISGCTPDVENLINSELCYAEHGPNVAAALGLLLSGDEIEGQEVISIIGALDETDNALWEAGDAIYTVEEALALPENRVRVLHGCSMGEMFDYGSCDGPVGRGGDTTISFGCCFYVITNMLSILEAATDGRVSPRRLWNLTMSRGHLDPSRDYGIPGVDYGPINDYMNEVPLLFGTLTSDCGTLDTEALASVEETRTPNNIADFLQDKGFWMWMRSDRFPIDLPSHASTSFIVTRPVQVVSKTPIMNLSSELLHIIVLQLPLSSIVTVARLNTAMYKQLVGSVEARDMLAKAYMRTQARWCLPFGEAERRWWDDRNGDDALGWDYLKRCWSESYSMRNRRRIWRAAESIEEECEREEALRANEVGVTPA